MEKCKNCKWWIGIEEAHKKWAGMNRAHGMCIRYPKEESKHPDERCGEFTEKP